jgi:hypothetical protein
MASASCTDLEQMACQSSFPSGIIECFDTCTDSTLECGDDSGSYAPEQRCDGFDFCEDGSDELGCAMFTCADDEQEKIVISARCDGFSDCFDSSDESGCTSLTTTCGTGGTGGTGGSGGSVSSGGSAGSGGSGGTITTGGTGGVPVNDYVASPTESCDRIMTKLGTCDTSDNYYFYCYDDTSTYDKCLADCVETATCADVLASACDIYTSNSVYTCWTSCFDTAYFLCDASYEVPEYWLCDGFTDCSDGTDEVGCPVTPTHTCPNDDYTYPDSYRCDGFNDCATDGADELGCACLAPAP